MLIILLGPPGAGKGTIAQYLSTHFNYVHISTGDMLREISKENSELGKKIKKIIENGELVDDATMNKVLLTELKNNNKNILLDGYPRKLSQAKFLEKHFKVKAVIYVKASEKTIIKRITSRRVCEKCGQVYNIITNKPKKQGICDKCGGRLIQRKDDTEEVVKQRLKTYFEQTHPLYDFYKNKGLIYELNSEKSIADFLNDAQEIIKRIK